MRKPTYNAIAFIFFIISLSSGQILAQKLDQFKYNYSFQASDNIVISRNQFNGYTNYWHDTYREWIRYGNLFKIAIPDVESTIIQSKLDIVKELGISGLTMQEGFLDGLLNERYISLDQPSPQILEESLTGSNVLAFVNPGSDVGKQLTGKLPESTWNEQLGSHQFEARDFKEINAFYLENGNRKLFVISTVDEFSRDRVSDLIENTKKVLSKYDLHRGWFGARSLLKSVTCAQGHPLEIIGMGMNEGNSWFVFDGYMDFLAKDELSEWINKVNLPVVTDVGFSPIYGCKDYEGLQVQDMATIESWINYAKEKEGYVFRPVYFPEYDQFKFDGYIATEGHKEQVDSEDVPFIQITDYVKDDAIPCMVLFTDKGKSFNNEQMWEAIMDRREVAVLEQGKMMGPELYRNVLQMLLLDRIFIEEYFGDRLNLEATTEGYKLKVNITNSSTKAVSGIVNLSLPDELKIKGSLSSTLNLPAMSSKNMIFDIQPGPEAMDRTNPIAVHFDHGKKRKSTLAILDLPPAISVHRLLYGNSPRVSYPVTIHNFTGKSSFPVKLEVIDKNKTNKVVFKSTQSCSTGQATFKDMVFELDVPPGDYQVKVSAMGVNYESQLGVGKPEGAPYLYELDLNSDGVNEYRMENDSVQITLLATGARVIEYIVKSRNDNVLFKLWPQKAIDDKRSFRKRGYYPYGGFEDFLGQGSMETHKVYDAEILKKEGDYVRVKMTADYYGNKLEKTFTLYGNSPLLEVRFALTFKNPEANVLGPQPILEIGEVHGTEDLFVAPTLDGMEQYRMRPEDFYGRVIILKEGWNAGYDTQEDITFVGAFPVDQPLFLHMWMNHPKNPEAHHYYAEFQPWTPIYQKSTMYFTYYIWGAGGPWENGVQGLRDRNLISVR
ncbi:hypothetical protein ACFLU5_10930 [Bacteroidota bacterium]